jgi:hypothetical protein
VICDIQSHMETKSQNDIILNADGTALWTLREDGDTVLQTYIGPFTFKCFLNPLETLAAGRLYRELLGNNSGEAGEQERYTAFALSQLKFRVVKAPPFWNTDSIVAGNIPDTNIISLILDRAISSEVLYKEELKKKRADALKKAADAVTALQASLNAKPDAEQD